MRTFKYVLFWLLLLVLITAIFWNKPLNTVGQSVFLLIPAGLIAWLAHRSARKKSKFKLPPNFSSRSKPSAPDFKDRNQSYNDLDAHAQLVRLCFGDLQKAERLIDYHLKKRPGINRGQATRDAVDSLLRDRRP